ncbi:MAG: bifunctional phosphoribosyl-AMP cyclohydrolase/phosphoribosyl-ATP diphosphatase HisIE [Eubacterium sp.]|nr:bifunctional phosphoribosyl-AMP cyclohydrolase/phosphoribosyl-ATP diphosphatase HisIE [Eubacterium sp.]MCI8918781.1 bifunctional phosphoribosyl-AMP cyclohydrolase/phosphoribosyl-ATP diphosphatase HisIE [Eubacterium sp.]
MERKILAATLYIKDGIPISSPQDLTPAGDLKFLAKAYNDGGIDKIFVFDLSNEDQEHEKNLHTIRELNRLIEIPTCGGGNIKRLEDVKKLLYAGCKQVLINSSKPYCFELVDEAASRFGHDKILVSVKNIDFIFKHREVIKEKIHEMLVMNASMLDAIENLTDTQYVALCQGDHLDELVNVLQREHSRGIYGEFLNGIEVNVMELKSALSAHGIKMDNFEPSLKWEDLKLNSDGMVPVIAQDYRTGEVLMLAYMNKEAFEKTITTGKMTYYSRSRGELWLKGMTSGHIQYVKSLTADCDKDTILAKVSQIGAACHTGKYSCFHNEIVHKEYMERNPLKVFEEEYAVILDRKEHPKEGSYTNYLFDKGIDKILKKLGEEAAEIIIAAKNPDPEEIKYEAADFLYHLMVLMVEKGLTWKDVTREVSQR